MSATIGAALMIAAVLLFSYLKAHESLAEQLRQTVPGIWVSGGLSDVLDLVVRLGRGFHHQRPELRRCP